MSGQPQMLAVAALMFTLVTLTPIAVAQTTAQPPSSPVEEPAKDPGFFQSVKNWFERGFAKFKGGLDDAKTNIDKFNDNAANAGKDLGNKAAQVGRDAADATKGAVDAMKKIPATRVVDGRERCEVAPNGAPDCRVAAQTICSAKGFAGGTSVDFVSAEKCPPTVWRNRRKPEPGECTTETFVTRAMCQ